VGVPPEEVEEAKLTLFLDAPASSGAPLATPLESAPSASPPSDSHRQVTPPNAPDEQQLQQQPQQGRAPPPTDATPPNLTLHLQLDELQVRQTIFSSQQRVVS